MCNLFALNVLGDIAHFGRNVYFVGKIEHQMKVSNRVKRNLALVLIVIGCMCIAGRAWDVAMELSSKMARFNLAGIVIITGACVDNFLIYRRRIKRGILFGRE